MFRTDLSANHALRLFEESDAESLYAVIGANRVHLSQWLPWAEHQTLEGARGRCAGQSSSTGATSTTSSTRCWRRVGEQVRGRLE